MAREYDPPPRTRATGSWRSDYTVSGQRQPEPEPDPQVDAGADTDTNDDDEVSS